MSQFIDFDPATGVSHWWHYDESTDVATITTSQDLQPLVDYCAEARATRATDKGIKAGWWLYAKLPAVIQVKMHQAGIRLSDPNATKRIIQWINEHAPHLKMTSKNDSGIAPKVYLGK